MDGWMDERRGMLDGLLESELSAHTSDCIEMQSIKRGLTGNGDGGLRNVLGPASPIGDEFWPTKLPAGSKTSPF